MGLPIDTDFEIVENHDTHASGFNSSKKAEHAAFLATTIGSNNIDLTTVELDDQSSANIGPNDNNDQNSENEGEIDISEWLNDPSIEQASQLSPLNQIDSDIPALDPNREAKPHSLNYNGIEARQAPITLQDNPDIDPEINLSSQHQAVNEADDSQDYMDDVDSDCLLYTSDAADD